MLITGMWEKKNNDYNEQRHAVTGKGYRLALIALGFVVLVTTQIGQMLFIYVKKNQIPDSFFIIERSVFIWFFWVMAVPAVYKLTKRFPLCEPGLLRNMAIHFVFAVVISPIHVLYNMGTYELLHHGTDPIRNVTQTFYNGLEVLVVVDILLYAVIAGVTQLISNYDQSKKRELKNLELESQLTTARLNVLKTQLQPHFLFNTLHGISSLIHENPEASRKMLNYLKILFEKSFNSDVQQLVLLEEELDLIGTYLEIEKTRLGNRMNVIWSIAPQSRSAIVPSLMLQPLVENAVKHGISQKINSGTIRLKTGIRNEMLELSVEDDGPGFNFNSPQRAGHGLGLQTTHERLFRLYDAFKFDITKSDLGGAKIEIRIPLMIHGSPLPFREIDYESAANYNC